MAESVVARVFKGSLNALLDPSLPLELLANPPWIERWRGGLAACCTTLRDRILAKRKADDVAAVLRAWAKAHGVGLDAEAVGFVALGIPSVPTAVTRCLSKPLATLSLSVRLDLVDRFAAMADDLSVWEQDVLEKLRLYVPGAST